MARCDPVLRTLDAVRPDAAAGGSPSAAPGGDSAARERQEQLLPVYHSIALHFAGMHDTPVRLLLGHACIVLLLSCICEKLLEG